MPADPEAILDHPLLPFSKNPADAWTIRNACEGTQIFGGTGSGKTSGSGRAIAISFLKNGFGGLVLTAKKEERPLWERYCQQAGRPPSDLIVLDPKSGFQFNFLDYEFNRPDDETDEGKHLTHNIVSLFLATLSTGEAAVSNADPFWNDALRELLTHAIDLAAIGSGDVHLPDLAAIIRSAPQSRAEIQSPTWQKKSRCFELLRAAAARAPALKKENPGRFNDLEETVAYWLSDFPNLSEKTRSIVVSSFTGKAAGLLRSPLRRMFCEKATPATDRVRPTESHRGKIIVVNLPVKEYGELGRFAQVIYKTVWQRATERRWLAGDWRPVFLWADESQYFVTAEDMLFQQTARSKMAATVYLTQNLPNYHAALGTRHGNAATDSLLGNLQTKIFHANGDPATNEWAERVFARKLQVRPSFSTGIGGHSQPASNASTNVHQAYEPTVPAIAFTKLQKGGVSPYVVQGIVFSGGRVWKGSDFGEDATAVMVSFPQQPEPAKCSRPN